MIPLPWRLLGGLVIALALFSGGYGLGAKHAKTECVAGQAKAQTTAVVSANTESARRETIGAARETSREHIRVIYKTIREQASETIADHPELNACGLDADGLRLWNTANTGETAPVSGEPYLSMHRAATREIGQPDGSVSEPHRGDGTGSSVPGSAGEAGRVRTGVIYD